MSTGTIPPITASPLVRRSQNLTNKSSSGNTYQNVKDQATHIGGQFLKIGGPIALTVVGFLSFLGSMLASSIAPDKTGMDWVSKILAVCGFGVAGTGIWKLIRLNKEQKNEPEKIALDVLSENEKTETRKVRNAIKNIDQSFQQAYDSGNLSKVFANNFDGESANNIKLVRENELKLYQTYKQIIDKYKLASKDQTKEPAFSNVAENVVTLTELKEELAILIGNITALRENANFAADPDCINLITDGLDDDEIKEPLSSRLPQDFVFAYEASRFYDKYHRNNNGSVEQIVKTALDHVEPSCTFEKFAEVLKGPEGAKKTKAEESLGLLTSLYNNLKVFQQALSHVMNYDVNDSTKARQAAILRQAIIAGLRLHCKTHAELDKELKNILNGVNSTESLGVKLNDLKDKFELEFENKVVNKSDGKYSKTTLELSGIFPGSLGLFKLSEVAPQPVT